MSKIKVKYISLIVCLSLLLVIFSGCISPTELEPAPKGPTKKPRDPKIVINSIGEASLTWKIFDSGKLYLKYAKIDIKGNMSEEKIIGPRHIYCSKIIIDSLNYLYFFSTGGADIEYLKINENGQVLLDKKIPNSDYHGDTLSSTKRFDVVLDNDNIFHIIWVNTNLTASYTKIDSNGNILISRCLGNFFGEVPFLYNCINIAVYMGINSKYILHTIWQEGYRIYNTMSGEIGDINKNLSGNFIKIDSKNNNHILSGNNYKKINENGTFLKSEKVNNITKVLNYPVVEDDLGSYIFLGDNGCVDKENNIHIISEKVEVKSWESGRHHREYDFHTIYYNKLDKNGTVLTDNMIIDTDGEPRWENGMNSTYLIFLILLIAVPVVLIILIAIILYLKKYKPNRRT